MKKNEVKVGTVYRVKVSGSVQDVRITGENPHGGWDGVNTVTNRKVRIKSPQRLRAVAGERPAKRKTIVSLAEYEAEAKADAAKPADGVAETVAAVEKGNLGEGVTVPTGRKNVSARASEKRGRITDADKPHAANEATPAVAADTKKRSSGLDAAAMVLAEAGEPLNTKQMVERMLAKGLWQTGGRTPAATIYAAILRECATKGDASRFRKTERGKFMVVLPDEKK